MSDVNLVRTIIGIACLLLVVLIWFFGRPRKPGQGKRVAGRDAGGSRNAGERADPTLGEALERDLKNDRDAPGEDTEQVRLEALERSLAGEDDTRPGPLRASLVSGARAPQASQPTLGIRQDEAFDRIVTLYVAARTGHQLNGSDLVVAAEKAGLVHGHMSIYHRLVDGRPDAGPVFSVANMVKPGTFDLTRLQELRTPGISFFMTLPAPLPLSALDAWDTMLPTAQRMAELLDALVLDEERNALGRQRIAHIRDEMRAYDRRREQQVVRPTR
jgi:cell division protein ZipA